MAKPMKYDDLSYTPTHGEISVRGREGEWRCSVTTEQGRAMEADGIDVTWAYGNVPAWVSSIGLGGVFLALFRLWCWPSRLRRY